MGRELRKVPANWKHPKDGNYYYIPLLGHSFKEDLAEWEEGKKQWDAGFAATYDNANPWGPKKEYHLGSTYEEFNGKKPDPADYMPEWPESEKTHIQLYETTSEGTPLSPVFPKEQFEQLCEWAADNAPTFAEFKTSKEQWMKMLSEGLVSHTVGNITFI